MSEKALHIAECAVASLVKKSCFINISCSLHLPVTAEGSACVSTAEHLRSRVKAAPAIVTETTI